MNETKYLLAYSIPLSAIIGMKIGGIWSYTTVFYAFGFIPIWESILKPKSEPLNEEKIQNRLANRFFDLMLYFNIIIVFSMLFLGIDHLTSQSLPMYERIGLVLTLGIVLGTNGLNVAHELGHRTAQWEHAFQTSSYACYVYAFLYRT